MAAMIQDKGLRDRLQAERAATGADRHDEFWDGAYMMAPMPNTEHQLLVTGFTRVLADVITDANLGIVLPGFNISDQVDDWQSNFRVPDVAVFLNATTAQDHGAFWLGGPDLAIEIISPGDHTRQKLDFYAKVRTRELLVVDRSPGKWSSSD
ncbi:MAG: Uma2 family endonuclease [Planctomycetales bacterium]|nr:Uma2 family endonuclease [Planctomycetales bacterium]